MPESAEPIGRLLAHAIERGGKQCDPKSPRFGKCTLAQRAAALGVVFGFEHPLATERTQRRSEVLGRYTLES
jgi:hypothetical protein